MCMYVYMYVFVYVYVCIYLCIYLIIYIYVFIYIIRINNKNLVSRNFFIKACLKQFVEVEVLMFFSKGFQIFDPKYETDFLDICFM